MSFDVFQMKLKDYKINAATKLDTFHQDDIKDKMNLEDQKVTSINSLAMGSQLRSLLMKLIYRIIVPFSSTTFPRHSH